MKGRPIGPLLTISLRVNTANVSRSPTYASKHNHKNSFLCQRSATQIADPEPAPGYHCNQANIYSPALHPLHIPDWSLPCETSQHPPAWLPGTDRACPRYCCSVCLLVVTPDQDFSLRLAVSDWLPCCILPAAHSSMGRLVKGKNTENVHTHWECARRQWECACIFDSS